MSKIKAAVYTRVSTNKNEQQMSFMSQQSYYTQYCNEKEYELVNIYADEGLSGTTNKRKEFLNMMKDAGLSYTFGSSNKIVNFDRSASKPLFDLIIVKDVSRFARNTDVTRAAELLAEKGVYILFENNNLSTSKEGWQFELDLYLSFAKRESLDRSKKIKWARKHKIDQKKYHFSRVPFGYKYDKDSSSYVIDSEEAVFIEKIFEMYCKENKGSRLIAQWLTDNGVLNRTAKNSAARWNESTVSRMLENQVYVGNVVVNKYENNLSGSGIRKKVEKDEWIVLENAITPIISKEIFESARKIRESRRSKLNGNSVRGVKLSKDEFYKKIKCGLCSSEFVRVSGTKRNKQGILRTEVTYYCKNRRKYGTCSMRGVSYNVLVREMLKVSKKVEEFYANQPDRIRKIELNRGKQLLEILDEKQNIAETRKSQIENQIAKYEDEILEISQAFIRANDVMTKALNKKIDIVNKEVSQLLIQKDSFTTLEIDKERQRIQDRLDKIIESRNKKYNTLSDSIEALNFVTVNEGKILNFSFVSETLFFALSKVWELGNASTEYWTIEDDNITKSVSLTIESKY